VTGSLARSVTDRLRGRCPRQRHLRRRPRGRGRCARRLRSVGSAKGALPLPLLLSRLRQLRPPTLPRHPAAPLLPARRAAHLLRVPRRRRCLVPLPALRAPFPRTHDENDPPPTLPKARPPEPRRPRRRHPPPHRPHPRQADARSEGQESARSHPEPRAGARRNGVRRARRGWRGRDLARSEHGGTLRVSMGAPGPRSIRRSPPPGGGSVARRRWISRSPPAGWIICPPRRGAARGGHVDHDLAAGWISRRPPLKGGRPRSHCGPAGGA
jgi:hypothetical protein